MRIRLDIAYDGTHFRGWARQPGLRTVQGTLEQALARIVAGTPQLTVAGRTDAGVHASGQVAHLDLDEAQQARLAASRRSESDPVAALSSSPPLAELTAPAASGAAATPAEWGSTVGKSGLTWDLFFSNTNHDWSDEVDMGGLVRFLRGRYPDKTAANVSADTRLPADTVKKWLALVAAPNGRAMLVLACVYGPEVLVALLRRPPGWLLQSARMAEQVRLEAELAALTAKLARGAP